MLDYNIVIRGVLLQYSVREGHTDHCYTTILIASRGINVLHAIMIRRMMLQKIIADDTTETAA